MKKPYEDEEEDDGETIVNMNVDGMPWYRPDRADDAAGGAGSGMGGGEPLTKEQLRMYRFAAVKAGLLVALIFGAVYGLFIAFCDFVWFR